MDNSIMTNEMRELYEVSDDKKVEHIDIEDKNYLLQDLTEFSSALENALYGFDSTSILGWYNAYLLSPEFVELSREHKKEVILQYERIKHVITQLFDFVHTHGLGIFNTEWNSKQIL